MNDCLGLPGEVGRPRRQRSRAAERAELAGIALEADAYVWSQALDSSSPYRPDRVTAAFVSEIAVARQPRGD